MFFTRQPLSLLFVGNSQNLEGDPYQAILDLEAVSDAELSARIRALTNHLPTNC